MGIEEELSKVWEKSNCEAAAAYADACSMKKKIKTYEDFQKLDGFLRSLEHIITKFYMQQAGYTSAGGEWIKEDPKG